MGEATTTSTLSRLGSRNARIAKPDASRAVMVSAARAKQVAVQGNKHHEWDAFSKERLEAGCDLRLCYSLHDAAGPEQEVWLAAQRT